TVILYGGNNNWFAAYAYWYYKVYGHGPVKLLDGGRKAWELEGRELTGDPADIQSTSGYPVREPRTSIRAFRDQVLEGVPTGRGARRARVPPPPPAGRSSTAPGGWPPTRTWSPTAASASARPTPGSCCTSCSATRGSATTTAPGPSGAAWSACPSSADAGRPCIAGAPGGGQTAAVEARGGLPAPGPDQLSQVGDATLGDALGRLAEGAMVVDASGRMLYANAEAIRIWG